MSESPKRASPGLVKAQSGSFVRRRTLELVAAEDGRIREMVEAADVVSEGLAKEEGGRLVYYGSTSLLLPSRARGGALPEPEIETLAALLAFDPHLRLRAMRVARREAVTRARGDLGTIRAEITVQASTTGIVVLVDVVANVQASAAGGASR